MDRAQDYRAHAALAERIAAEAPNPDIRRQFLELAAGWRALAAYSEHLARRWPDRDSPYVAGEDPFIPKDPTDSE
jgi:hypothetical protein